MSAHVSRPKGVEDIQIRKCLYENCGEMFLSSWIGERQCKKCKERQYRGNTGDEGLAYKTEGLAARR